MRKTRDGNARVTVPPRETIGGVPQESNRSGLKAESPYPEMVRRLHERHPKVIVWQCEHVLRTDMLKHGLTWENIRDLDDLWTKNPKIIRNPPAYYRDLLRHPQRTAAAEILKRARPLLIDREGQRCTECDRSGRLAGGAYCTCDTGRHLARIECKQARETDCNAQGRLMELAGEASRLQGRIRVLPRAQARAATMMDTAPAPGFVLSRKTTIGTATKLIQKLLALASQAGTEAESALATQRIAELNRKYNAERSSPCLEEQAVLDRQTTAFIAACKENPQLIQYQFDFYAGSIEERDRILSFR